jgi:hypothetical protein
MSYVGWNTDLVVQRCNGYAFARRAVTGEDALMSTPLGAGSEVEPVQRAPHAATSPVQHVGVDHGRSYAPVAQELLDGADVVAILEKMCGEGVA